MAGGIWLKLAPWFQKLDAPTCSYLDIPPFFPLRTFTLFVSRAEIIVCTVHSAAGSNRYKDFLFSLLSQDSLVFAATRQTFANRIPIQSHRIIHFHFLNPFQEVPWFGIGTSNWVSREKLYLPLLPPHWPVLRRFWLGLTNCRKTASVAIGNSSIHQTSKQSLSSNCKRIVNSFDYVNVILLLGQLHLAHGGISDCNPSDKIFRLNRQITDICIRIVYRSLRITKMSLSTLLDMSDEEVFNLVDKEYGLSEKKATLTKMMHEMRKQLEKLKRHHKEMKRHGKAMKAEIEQLKAENTYLQKMGNTKKSR